MGHVRAMGHALHPARAALPARVFFCVFSALKAAQLQERQRQQPRAPAEKGPRTSPSWSLYSQCLPPAAAPLLGGVGRGAAGATAGGGDAGGACLPPPSPHPSYAGCCCCGGGCWRRPCCCCCCSWWSGSPLVSSCCCHHLLLPVWGRGNWRMLHGVGGEQVEQCVGFGDGQVQPCTRCLGDAVRGALQGRMLDWCGGLRDGGSSGPGRVSPCTPHAICLFPFARVMACGMPLQFPSPSRLIACCHPSTCPPAQRL